MLQGVQEILPLGRMSVNLYGKILLPANGAAERYCFQLCVCLSLCLSRGCPHLTITHDALDRSMFDAAETTEIY